MRIELLLFALPSSNSQMCILGSIVREHPSWPTTVATAKFSKCCSIRRQFVSRDFLPMDALVLEQLAQRPQRSAGIATLLDQHVQDFAFVVDRTPQPRPLAADLHQNFIEMPTAGRLGSGLSEISSEQSSELQAPTADCLVAGVNAALSKHFLDILKAQSEPEIETNAQADDIRRKFCTASNQTGCIGIPIRSPILARNGESLELV